MEPIVAPVTAMIPQPVGILRISGEGSWCRIRPLFPDLPDELEHRRVYLAVPVQENLPLDECLLLFFRGPHSFTGEDVIEIQAHGNPHNMRALLSLIQKQKIRIARPGEFSLRAYQNRKLTLLKAESLHRMILAPSYNHFLSSHRHYDDVSGHPLSRLHEDYLDLLALLFTLIDHPDSEEDRESLELSREFFLSRLSDFLSGANRLLAEFRQSRQFYSGFTILLTGPPNSGKSSLFNRLLKQDRAIVSPSPGTTRDLVEGRLSSPSGDIVFLDSAGLRLSSEPIELKGIKKTLSTLRRADCVLQIDSPTSSLSQPFRCKPKSGTRILHVWNKCDLSPPPTSDLSIPPFDFSVSARTRKGIPLLLKTLENLADSFYRSPSGLQRSGLDSERQKKILLDLLHILRPVSGFLARNQYDLALSSLEEGRRLLDDGVGMVPSSDVYDRVFRRFCLGK